MDDPATQIQSPARRRTGDGAQARTGHSAQLFYIEGHVAAMHPTAVERTPQSFAFADVIPLHAAPLPDWRPPAPLPAQAQQDVQPQNSIRTPAGAGALAGRAPFSLAMGAWPTR